MFEGTGKIGSREFAIESDCLHIVITGIRTYINSLDEAKDVVCGATVVKLLDLIYDMTEQLANRYRSIGL